MSGGPGDDGEERSHAPSQKRLDDARKRGDIPKSDEITTAAVYLGLVAAALGFGIPALEGAGRALSVFLGQADGLSGALLGPGGGRLSAGLVAAALAPLWPLLVFPALFALAALAGQRAIVVATERLRPRLSRLSPIAGFKNKFGAAGLFDFFKRVVKLLAITAAVAAIMAARSGTVLGSARATPPTLLGVMLDLCLQLLLAALAIAAVIAAADVVWVRFDHERKLRMTLKELRDEARESEGDPMFKARRRRRANEIATGRMLQDVPQADVVIVNPSHYAVALKWSRARGEAPRCVAKGVDEVALNIRRIAAGAGVPIHADPPTARALHATVEIGREIGPEHYRAVAAAIRFSDRIRARMRERNGFGE